MITEIFHVVPLNFYLHDCNYVQNFFAKEKKNKTK